MSIHKKYLDKIIPQHRTPKFQSWLSANLDLLQDIVKSSEELEISFIIDNAVGKQLDITGEIVGRERLLSFEPPFGLSPILNDELYRTLQKAKISINQWDGTIPSAYELWKSLFPQFDFVLHDNQNMTIDLHISGNPLILEMELMARGYVAPKPMGVRIRYEFILPKYELEREIYIGSILHTDSAYINISKNSVANMSLKSNLNVGVGVADISYIILPTVKIRDS